MEILSSIDNALVDFMNLVNEPMGLFLLIALIISSVWFSIRTRFVQIRLFPDMIKQLFKSGKTQGKNQISSFQAFVVSIASRVGTGNLAGVATAIVIGGPGAVFWMWVMALIGSANAFIESTLSQLFKTRTKDAFIGGPAYYIYKGMHSKWFAFLFAITIIAEFGFTNNMVQSNTISIAFSSSFGISTWIMALILAGVSLIVFFGGIHRIASVSSVLVPFMAIAYLLLAAMVICINIDKIPYVFTLIVKNAFGIDQFVGGSVGTAILVGFKRGLFSNEAGEGSTPNAAATADTTHPVKQGLIQALGVYTDTLLICSCTAFIILCSGVFDNGQSGIELTQTALNSQIGPSGSYFISLAILMFAYSSIIANYYYGECNLYFMTHSTKARTIYRITVGLMIFIGALSTPDLAWAFVDFAMVLMAVTNIIAICVLGKYAIRCLDDYTSQLKQGKDPIYHKSVNPEIANDTECWDE